jgi:hypothetical protein
MYYIGLFEAKDGPRWRLMHKNGNILSTSESYSNLKEREDTVVNLAISHKFEIRNMDTGKQMTISEGRIVELVE